MNPLWIIVGAMAGFTAFKLWEVLSYIEWRPRRCKRGKPCGCKTLSYGCGLYRICDDSPASDVKPTE